MSHSSVTLESLRARFPNVTNLTATMAGWRDEVVDFLVQVVAIPSAPDQDQINDLYIFGTALAKLKAIAAGQVAFKMGKEKHL